MIKIIDSRLKVKKNVPMSDYAKAKYLYRLDRYTTTAHILIAITFLNGNTFNLCDFSWHASEREFHINTIKDENYIFSYVHGLECI